MKVSFSKLLLVVLTVLSMATFTNCSSAKKKGEGSESSSTVNGGDNGPLTLELNGDSDQNKAGELRTVFFDFDSAQISAETKESLTANAAYLKANKSLKVQVEGHCDERGGIQYNLALGERRARSVKEFLAASGVTANRVSIVSYGKEKPLDPGHDEAAWSKNRRANFVITEK
ncbi:MAG: peptidoglycan-associated lipoprotein Pal [Bacteriovoracaceae bacterium]